jgi:hypothetical protein
MDWTRLVVRGAIVAAVAGGIALFFAVGVQRRAPPETPPAPAAQAR